MLLTTTLPFDLRCEIAENAFAATKNRLSAIDQLRFFCLGHPTLEVIDFDFTYDTHVIYEYYYLLKRSFCSRMSALAAANRVTILH